MQKVSLSGYHQPLGLRMITHLSLSTTSSKSLIISKPSLKKTNSLGTPYTLSIAIKKTERNWRWVLTSLFVSFRFFLNKAQIDYWCAPLYRPTSVREPYQSWPQAGMGRVGGGKAGRSVGRRSRFPNHRSSALCYLSFAFAEQHCASLVIKFLNKDDSHLWTRDDIRDEKILGIKWWKQVSHHLSRVPCARPFNLRQFHRSISNHIDGNTTLDVLRWWCLSTERTTPGAWASARLSSCQQIDLVDALYFFVALDTPELGRSS